MQGAPNHPSEAQRIAELLRFDVLDSEDEKAFDELTELASHICQTPISLISLIDTDRQWFKSRVGIDAQETPREQAFCAHAILQPGLFEVPDALKDVRFADNPLVQGDPDIRFYAGAPLVTSKGLPIGTLCVIDKTAKTLSLQQKRALEILANQVMGQLELRLNYKKLQQASEERQKIFSVIGHDLRSPFNGILGLSQLLYEKASDMSHEQTKDMAGHIYGSSLQVFQIIDELMQWTQQRLGRIVSNVEPCSLMKAVNDTLGLLKDAITLKQLACDVNIEPHIDVLADGAILKTILRNLLNNAIKYSNEGGMIRIDAQVESDHMSISIEDQGSGVSPHVIEQLFNNTVESEVDTEGLKGSGIGLSLCAELIATQGGSIRVDETYTQGARIIFTLPSST